MRNIDIWKIQRDKAWPEASGLKVYSEPYKDNKNYHLIIWKPKAKKPFVNYLYRNLQEVNIAIKKYNENYMVHLDRVKENRETRKVVPAMMDNVLIGDIFVWSWGYDQTNLDWFQVVKKSGKGTVVLQAITHKRALVSNGGSDMSGYFVPVKDSFLTGNNAKTLKKRVQFSNNEPYVSMPYGWCGKWTGDPRYCSWYA